MTQPTKLRLESTLIVVVGASLVPFVPRPVSASQLGDMDCDTVVSGLDIQPFMQAILDPAGYAADHPGCLISGGDIDGDGSVSAEDAPPFVSIVLTGGATPVTLTTTMIGTEDVSSPIMLAAVDPIEPDASFQFTITSLPIAGQLMQSDGTPISAAPALVTDPDGIVRYLGEEDACTFPGNSSLASFGYTATSLPSGRVSSFGDVAIYLTPVYDAVEWWPPGMGPPTPLQATEDTPLYFQLPPSPEGRYYITETFDDFGLFYQVESDNLTPGSLIIIDTSTGHAPVQVTNAANWLLFVPGVNQNGDTTAFFAFAHSLDHWPELPLYANDLRVDVDVAAVNDAPVAYSGNMPAPNFALNIQFDVQYNDAADGSVCHGSMTVDITTLPQTGRLYVGHYANTAPPPEQEVTATNHEFGGCITSFTYVRDATDWDFIYQTECPFDAISFRASDGELLSAEVSYTFCFFMQNLPPVMDPDWESTVTLSEDVSGITQFTPTDDDGYSNINVRPISLPLHGTLYYLQPQFQAPPLRMAVELNTPLPLPLGEELNYYQLEYVPNPDFNTAGGPPDSWSFQLEDYEYFYTIDTDQPIAYDFPRRTFTQQFEVLPVNDAPVINAPASVPAQFNIPFTIENISVSDDAAPADVLTVNIFCTTGLNIQLIDPGTMTILQNGPGQVLVEGTLAQLSLGLNATALSPVDQTIIIIVQDHGAGGPGEPMPLSATKSITVNLGP